VLEVALVDGDDDGVFDEELGKESASPEALLVVDRVSVLEVCLLEGFVPQVELLLHDLPHYRH
jgi:hypothetical protein